MDALPAQKNSGLHLPPGQKSKNGTLSRACQGAQELVACVQYRLRLLSDPGQVAAAGPSTDSHRSSKPRQLQLDRLCIADADGPFRAPFESVGLLTAPNEDSEAHSDVRSEAVFPSPRTSAALRAAIELCRNPRLTAEIS